MDTMINIASWQPTDLIMAAFVTLIVLFSLGFALWKALADSQWTPYWNVASILTALGAIALAITASRVMSADGLVNASWAVLLTGVFMAVCGAIYDGFHRYNLHRKELYYHSHSH